jgi:glycyl-tRNA synthetase
MRQLSRLLRANCFSSSLSLRRPQISTPPALVYPTKTFATTPTHLRFQVPTRKKDFVVMAGDMTTYKGKPFDRASLESLMKVCTTYFLTLCVLIL